MEIAVTGVMYGSVESRKQFVHWLFRLRHHTVSLFLYIASLNTFLYCTIFALIQFSKLFCSLTANYLNCLNGDPKKCKGQK